MAVEEAGGAQHDAETEAEEERKKAEEEKKANRTKEVEEEAERVEEARRIKEAEEAERVEQARRIKEAEEAEAERVEAKRVEEEAKRTKEAAEEVERVEQEVKCVEEKAKRVEEEAKRAKEAEAKKVEAQRVEDDAKRAKEAEEAKKSHTSEESQEAEALAAVRVMESDDSDEYPIVLEPAAPKTKAMRIPRPHVSVVVEEEEEEKVEKPFVAPVLDESEDTASESCRRSEQDEEENEAQDEALTKKRKALGRMSRKSKAAAGKLEVTTRPPSFTEVESTIKESKKNKSPTRNTSPAPKKSTAKKSPATKRQKKNVQDEELNDGVDEKTSDMTYIAEFIDKIKAFRASSPLLFDPSSKTSRVSDINKFFEGKLEVDIFFRVLKKGGTMTLSFMEDRIGQDRIKKVLSRFCGTGSQAWGGNHFHIVEFNNEQFQVRSSLMTPEIKQIGSDLFRCATYIDSPYYKSQQLAAKQK